MQAREAYAAGRYQDALDIYVKLYAEKLHPNYLRNIGRCYQNLGEPDKAISSFREYLRKARNLAPGEREEIEGYIREMEELKRSRRRPASPPAAPTDRAADPGAAGDPRAPAAAAVAAPPPAPAERRPSTSAGGSGRPWARRWWGERSRWCWQPKATRTFHANRPGMQLNRPAPGAAWAGLLALVAACGGSESRALVPVDINPGPVAGIKTVEITVSEVPGDKTVKRQSFDWTAASGAPLKVGVYLPDSFSGNFAVRARAHDGASEHIGTSNRISGRPPRASARRRSR